MTTIRKRRRPGRETFAEAANEALLELIERDSSMASRTGSADQLRDIGDGDRAGTDRRDLARSAPGTDMGRRGHDPESQERCARRATGALDAVRDVAESWGSPDRGLGHSPTTPTRVNSGGPDSPWPVAHYERRDVHASVARAPDTRAPRHRVCRWPERPAPERGWTPAPSRPAGPRRTLPRGAPFRAVRLARRATRSSARGMWPSCGSRARPWPRAPHTATTASRHRTLWAPR